MKAVLFLIGFICLELSAFGQTIVSQVIDSKSGKPISYVNIGIVGKNIGTVSNENGEFQLIISEALDTDSLRFSMVSYNTKTIAVADLRGLDFNMPIEMVERQIELQEVIVSAQRSPRVILGLDKKYCYLIPLFKGATSNLTFPQKGSRHEIGTRFPNSQPINIDSIQINFAYVGIDSVVFRLNIYAIEKDKMRNIMSAPIYIALSKEEALDFPIINLEHHQLDVSTDFLVTIENYKKMPYGSTKLLANFKSKGSMYPTYYRNNSQSNWVKLQTKKLKNIGLSIMVYAN